MHFSRFLKVLVAGGAALTSGCSNEVAGGGSGGGATSSDTSVTSGGPGTTSSSSGDAGAGQGGAGGVSGVGGSGQGGGATDCECTEGQPIHCGPAPITPASGVCCMWMFGVDEPCCDKL